ncbi:MAG: SCO family protein [Dehalococcoidia bacterium]|nr:SCO family protein [Dehalococcoidia bacterium]
MRPHYSYLPNGLGLARVAVLGWALALLLGACARAPEFNSKVIEATPLAPELRLVEGSSGAPFDLREASPEVTVVYFGYTHCPDVCPLMMGSLTAAMRQLPEGDRDDVRVVMVTIDPERDTPEIMGRYVAQFDQSFIGLSGEPADVGKAIADWRIEVFRGDKDAYGSYFMSHPAGAAVLDARRRMRLEIPSDASPAQIAADLRTLLQES